MRNTTSDTQSQSGLRKQDFTLAKRIAFINCITVPFAVTLLVMLAVSFMDSADRNMPVLSANQTFLAILAAVLLTTPKVLMYRQFSRYLINFINGNAEFYLRMMIAALVGIAATGIAGCIYLCWGTGPHSVKAIFFIVLAVFVVIYILGRYAIAEMLYISVDDFVGGMEDGILLHEKIAYNMYIIPYMPYYLYSIFDYAENYAKMYGYKEG